MRTTYNPIKVTCSASFVIWNQLKNCGKEIHIHLSTYLWFSAKCAEKKVEKWKVCQTPQNIKLPVAVVGVGGAGSWGRTRHPEVIPIPIQMIEMVSKVDIDIHLLPLIPTINCNSPVCFFMERWSMMCKIFKLNSSKSLACDPEASGASDELKSWQKATMNMWWQHLTIPHWVVKYQISSYNSWTLPCVTTLQLNLLP